MRWCVPATCVALVGCFGGNNVKGEISGQEPVILGGYYGEEDEIDPDTGDGLVVITLTDVDDPCENAAAVNNELEDAETASDLEEAWETYLPEDFWQITLILRVSDPADDQSGLVFEGVAWDELLEKDGEVYGLVDHYSQHLDEAYWNGVEDPEDYFESWFTDGGDLEVKKHEIGESFKGTFVTEAADPTDGDIEGDLEISFSVDRCPGMERYLFE